MSDEFEDAIRDRMGGDGETGDQRGSAPLREDPRGVSLSVCDYLTRFHADTVEKMWSRTDREGKEHASAFWNESGQPAAFSPVEGNESSVKHISPPDDESLGRIDITAHTHPGFGVSLSASDWRSFAQKLQFPPERVDWQGQETLRGIAVIGQRGGDEDEGAVTIRGLWGTREHTRLSIDEQNEVYSELDRIAREADPFQRGVKIQEELGGLFKTCTTTFEL